MKERKARKAAKAHGRDRGGARLRVIIEEKPRGQRQQPKRKDRGKPRPVTDEVSTPQPGADDVLEDDPVPARGRDARGADAAAATPTRPSPRSSAPRHDERDENSMTSTQPDAPVETTSTKRLEDEGEIAADYLEELLDIADLDGDIDIDVDHGRAAVEIVCEDPADRALRRLAGDDGEVLDALQELTRLAVQAQDRRAQPADARRRRLPVGAPGRAGRPSPRRRSRR